MRNWTYIAALSIWLGLWAPGLVDAQTQDAEPPAETPSAESGAAEGSQGADWLTRMLDREVDPLPEIEVSADDGFFRARVPAKLLEPVGEANGARHLMLDFGAGADHLAECYVYNEDLDLAGSLLSFSDGVFDAVAGSYGEIEAKAVLDVTAGAVGGSPYLGIEWLYRVRTESGATAGQAKHLIASKNRRAVYCQSSSVGYSQAFFGLFRSLLESLEYGEPLPAPHYREISVASIGEQVLGVSHQAHRVDDDGDVEIVEKLSMLVPMGESGGFQAEDSVTMEYSTPRGDLLGQVEVEAADGQIVSHVALRRFESGAWAVQGGFRGKNLDTILSTAPKLRSSLGRRLDFRDFAAGAEIGSTWTTDVWMVEVDPVRLLETRGTFLGGRVEGASVQLETGPMAVTALSDPTFSFTLMTVPVGQTQMILRRVHQQGDVFHPTTLPPKPDRTPTPKTEDAPNTESEPEGTP